MANESAEKGRGDATVGLRRRGEGIRLDTARGGGETTCISGVGGPRVGVGGPSSGRGDWEELLSETGALGGDSCDKESSWLIMTCGGSFD